jgi:hypothetical protein
METFKVGDWVRGSDKLREATTIVWNPTLTLNGPDSYAHVGYRRVVGLVTDGSVTPTPGMPPLEGGAVQISDAAEKLLVHPIYVTHVPSVIQAFLEEKHPGYVGRIEPSTVPVLRIAAEHLTGVPFQVGDSVVLDPACTRPVKSVLALAPWPQTIRLAKKYQDGSIKDTIFDGATVTFDDIGGEWSAKRFKLATGVVDVVAEVKSETTWLNGRPISAKTAGSPATPGKERDCCTNCGTDCCSSKGATVGTTSAQSCKKWCRLPPASEAKPANERRCGNCKAVVHQHAPIKQGKGLLANTDMVFCEACVTAYTAAFNAVQRAERERQITEAKAELDRPMKPRYAILTGDVHSSGCTDRNSKVVIFAGGGNSPRGRR